MEQDRDHGAPGVRAYKSLAFQPFSDSIGFRARSISVELPIYSRPSAC